MNIVQFLAHSIEEHDQLKLLSELGHTVFSPGAYTDPANPSDDKRPALPDVPSVPEMRKVVDMLGQPNHKPHGRCDGVARHENNVDAAKVDTPDEMIDWADVFIVHHLEHTWVLPQWDRLKRKRVIWRTVGQSAHPNETLMAPLRREGLEIVRYSPKERNIPNFAGQDALIRFYKDPAEWYGWTGEDPVVTNITQGLYQRSLDNLGRKGLEWTNYSFWAEATAGLPTKTAGPGSEVIGGLGAISLDEMKNLLRTARCYLYTGTQPASYTLGLIEAMMTGIPVVSIGPEHFGIMEFVNGHYGPLLFEGHEIALQGSENPARARDYLSDLLKDEQFAKDVSWATRLRAIELFGKDWIAAQWRAYLAGRTVPQQERELVAV